MWYGHMYNSRHKMYYATLYFEKSASSIEPIRQNDCHLKEKADLADILSCFSKSFETTKVQLIL